MENKKYHIIDEEWIENQIKFNAGANLAYLIIKDEFPSTEMPKQEWISVKDRLPEDRILPVLIFNGKAEVYCQCVLQATWFNESKSFKIETGTNITKSDITHWQPLPSKPKQL